MKLTTERIRELIEGWSMKAVIMDGEEKLQATPPSQREMDKYREYIKANKDFFLAEIKKMESEKAQREAKIQAIEGLKELKAAIAQEQYEYEQRQKRWESESLSSIIPQKPIVSVAELKTRFPRAAAYVKAENWTLSNNSGKRQAGKKALERIINGEYHEQVLADMEAEWNAYTKQHIWD
jgi:hypothetical protein